MEEHGIRKLDHTFFSEKAWLRLHISGYVNSQNTRIWSSDNPHVLHEQPLHSQKFVVWCVIFHRRIVGPIFFETTLNSEVYADIITQFISLMEVDER